MTHGGALFEVLVFLIAAVVVVPLLRRVRFSPVLGYLVAGLIIGPSALNLIRDAEAAAALAEFGVVFLLFMIGLELSIARLRRLARLVFGLGGVQVLVTGILIGGIAWAVSDIGINAAIVVGAGLALSSTAFVLQLLGERGERTTHFGNAAFAILLLQDLAIVPLLILVPLLGQEGPTLLIALGSAILRAAIALVLVMFIGRLVLRPAYRIIAGTGSSELFVAATLLTVLGTAWLLSLVGLSMALGAFLAGLLLAETEYRHQVEADIRPFRGVLLGLFFMTVGMSVDLGVILSEAATVIVVAIGLLVGKGLLITGLGRLFALPWITAGRVGLLLAQGGEFGLLLFGVAMAEGILAPSTGQPLIAAIILSMAATPVMAHLGGRLAIWLERRTKQPLALPPDDAELSHHVLIVGFGRVGQTVGNVLSENQVPYVALDLDHALIARCRAKGLPAFYGDANEVAVLHAAGAERARAAVITIDRAAPASRAVAALHHSFPELQIFVRARDLKHSRDLAEQGAAAVVLDTLEASLQLGGVVLRSLGSGTDQVAELLQDFREDDYAKMQDIVTAHDPESGRGS